MRLKEQTSSHNRKHADMPKSIEKVTWRFPLDYCELFHFPRTIVSNCLPTPLIFIFSALYAVFCHSGASQLALVVKNPPANVGDLRDAVSIPGLGGSPGGGYRNPLQNSCLENSMNGGPWRAMFHGVQRAGLD